MQNKIRVGILFGGQSAEHEVSLQTARNVYEAIDKEKYDVTLIGIDKKGQWYLNDASHFLLNETNPKLIALNTESDNITLLPYQSEKHLMNISKKNEMESLDVVFPLLHGPYGEDGTIQGLLKLTGVPFVGADVLGSAVGMDKDVCKRLLRDSGLPIGKFLVYNNKNEIAVDEVIETLGMPLFIKPANLGSSVGVSKAHNENEFMDAVEKAFEYDNKIIIEEFIKGREIECSVLGNDNPTASLPGEIIPTHEFYDYDAKYIDENGATLEIPANLPSNIVKKVQDLAIHVFKTLCCAGMARVDFFLTDDNKLYVNEINTIPGFTKISMYPKLWEKSGIPYTELIDRLISLAIERQTKEKIKTSFS